MTTNRWVTTTTRGREAGLEQSYHSKHPIQLLHFKNKLTFSQVALFVISPSCIVDLSNFIQFYFSWAIDFFLKKEEEKPEGGEEKKEGEEEKAEEAGEDGEKEGEAEKKEEEIAGEKAEEKMEEKPSIPSGPTVFSTCCDWLRDMLWQCP